MNRDPLLGDRVRISPMCPWAKGATATVMGGVQGDAMKFRRIVASSERPLVYYFLAFDQPQLDAKGDGPFIGAEIESRFIELLDSAA
jgi:hypothetical protein